MRKLSVLGAAVLSVAAVSSVYAGTPPVTPLGATTTVSQSVVPASRHWVVTFKKDALHGRGRLFASRGWRFGWLEVQAWGLAKGDKVEVTIVEMSASGSSTLFTATRMVRAQSGRIAFLVRLDGRTMTSIKDALAAKDTLEIEVASAAITASGTFAPARG